MSKILFKRLNRIFLLITDFSNYTKINEKTAKFMLIPECINRDF